MKKYFLSLVAMAAAMLFATSCQESLVEPQVGGPTTFTVQLPEQMGTKAAPIGSAANVTDLYYEVYSNGSRIIKASTKLATTGATNVELSLIQDQSYDIYFWAQNEGAYNVDDLTSIPIHNADHNTELRAAFFHVEKNFVPSGTSTPIVLVRPFSQLNLGATTLSTTVENFSLKKSSVTVKGVATKFNTYDGVGEGTQDLVFDYADVPGATLTVSNNGSDKDYHYISMDYFAVSGDEKALVEVVANIESEDGKVINHTFTNVPVQENYRTNIIGNLISSTTDFQITIDDNFVKDSGGNIVDNKYHVVDNVAAANAVLAAGETYVAINYIKNDETITLPDASEYYLQIPEVDATLNIVGTSATKLFVNVVDNTSITTVSKLNINTPNATVTITGPGVELQSLTASTAPNTLILDGITVAEVVIKQGNVVAQNSATVSNLSVDDNLTEKVELKVYDTSSITVADADKDEVTYIIEISSAEQLIALSGSVNKGDTYEGTTIVLTEDIDLTGVTTDGDSFGPIGRYCSGQGVNAPFKGHFDGQGHTIKGIYQSGWDFGYEWGTTGYLGLFGYVMDATIENLTIEGMESVVEGGTLAAIAGRADGECTFKNITVKNTKLGTYNNRCGGIVGWTGGYYKDEAQTEVACYFTFEDINICEDVVLGGLWGSFDSSIGGIMGQLNSAGSASFKNVTVSCRIDAYNDCTASYDYYLYRMCGMLIGQMTKTTTIDGSTYPDVAAYGIDFTNVTVNYGQWMNYHYCEPTPGLNGGRGMRVEAGFTYDGLPADYDHTQCVDNHYNCIPFDQLFGGTQTACKGVKAWAGVTVNYPEEYTCPLCGEQHNVD